MVVITGSAVLTISLVSLLIGGGGVWTYFKYIKGDDDWPNISNSSFGFSEWEKKTNNDLIGLNFDIGGDGTLLEIGLILIVIFIVFMTFCCGCHNLPSLSCWKEKKHRRRQERREKMRKKREKQKEEEEIEAERRRRKRIRRNMEHKIKLAKQISKGHWSVRYIDENRNKQIIREARGEGTGRDEGSCVVGKQEVTRRPSTGVEETGSVATMETGDRRRSSIVGSASVWSSTSADDSSWYCGSQIHHRTSLCTYNEDQDQDREGSVSVASTTTINMEG